MLDFFYNKVIWKRSSGKAGEGWQVPFVADTGAAPSRRSRWSTPRPARKCSRPTRRSRRAPPTRPPRTGSRTLLIPTEEVFGRYSALDLIDESTGRIYIEAGEEVSPDNLEKIDKAGIDRLELLDIDHVSTGPWIRNTMQADKAENREEGLEAIYKVMRPGEPPTKETAEALFEGLFFDGERYDLRRSAASSSTCASASTPRTP
jgi:DNA-directed RNA polymerase subunit beta